MKVLSWNIRGLNKAFKQREIRKVIRLWKISILCLVETKVRQENMDRVISNTLPGWEVLHNYGAHCYGRIWICWDPRIADIHSLDVHEQVLTCNVCPKSGKDPWILSTVYGANHGVDRKRLLQQLIFIKESFCSIPWLLVGDFNVIRLHHERSSTGMLNCYELDFGACIQSIEVVDLPFTGCLYTWSNKQAGDSFVAKKLDRVMASMDWLQRFGNTSVEFLDAGVSDHSPAVIVVEPFISFGPKPFKFFNFWAAHKLFLEWIVEGWSLHFEGYAMFKLYAKLKAVRSCRLGML
jgi:exonuclease III